MRGLMRGPMRGPMRGLMRGLTRRLIVRPLVALLLFAALAARAEEPPAKPAAIGFDHLIHDGLVVSGNGKPPVCLDCHALDARQAPIRPGHAACYSAGCHVMPKATRGKTAADATCVACHTSTTPTGKKARAFYPPYDRDLDHGVRFAHDKHVGEAAGKDGCETCHQMEGAKGAKTALALPHARCASCHAPGPGPATRDGTDAVKVGMKDCSRCHPSVAGRVVPPHVEHGPYAVTFSHDGHLAAGQGKGARCLGCHGEIEKIAGDVLPAPSMKVCERCHDGKKAFAALGPNCNRCHTKPDRRALPSDAPPARFQHAAHQERGLELACASCHQLEADGSPAPASADHQPCASCHADDFRAPQPRTCGGCHVGTEPSRDLHADVARNPWTEFGVEFDHAAHLAGATPRSGGACADCHTGIPGGAERRLGKGHASCAGTGCHGTAAGAGAKPGLGECASCHRQGLLRSEDGRDAKLRSTWSVTARFRHGQHATDAAGAALPCVSCHGSVLATKTIAEIRSPGKASCDGCHDGERAFKMTGHGCARCHGSR